jgi:hypothetical protein
MINQKDHLISNILEKGSSSELKVIVNGSPRIIQNSWLFARAKPSEKTVEFYTKYSQDNKVAQFVNPSYLTDLVEDVYSGQLFGYNFTAFQKRTLLKDNLKLQVFVEPSLGYLVLESPMYTILRNTLAKSNTLRVNFKPTIEGDKQLDFTDLQIILDRLRLNAFKGLLRLERLGLVRKVKNHSHPFYKTEDVFTPCRIQTAALYHPLFDDTLMYSLFSRTELCQAMLSKSRVVSKINTTVSFLSHRQLSELFNLRELMPFNYGIFLSLVAGNIIPVEQLTKEFPNKNKTVFLLENTERHDLDKVVDEEEFLSMTPYIQQFYTRSNSLVAFLATNFRFYQSKNYRRFTRLVDVMSDLEIK